MITATNHFTVIVLMLGAYDGQYLRVDPAVRHINWEGEFYCRIPGTPAGQFYHVRQAMFCILRETGMSLDVAVEKFWQWYAHLPESKKIKEYIQSADLDQRIIALLNCVLNFSVKVDEIFPELRTP